MIIYDTSQMYTWVMSFNRGLGKGMTPHLYYEYWLLYIMGLGANCK